MPKLQLLHATRLNAPDNPATKRCNRSVAACQISWKTNGLHENTLIYKYPLPLLEAEETIYAQYKRKFKDQRQVAVLTVHLTALKEASRLDGSYAPRDPKEAEQFGINVVVVDIPRPPRND